MAGTPGPAAVPGDGWCHNSRTNITLCSIPSHKSKKSRWSRQSRVWLMFSISHLHQACAAAGPEPATKVIVSLYVALTKANVLCGQ